MNTTLALILAAMLIYIFVDTINIPSNVAIYKFWSKPAFRNSSGAIREVLKAKRNLVISAIRIPFCITMGVMAIIEYWE
jgi:hypothetical protein